ncbi:biotin--protein ligase [Brienomyrus brachyistius]|uniref:biotin--protein ligase n=1 Tax=Brienomyrus brachyistius TaxID=42636 RepID=UPI0020B1F532|nr:biotin--protein ligase [Brienomyrus brachyistius]
MLITLCYVYLWVRFQKCYTVVIRSAVRRLYGSRAGFAFCTVRPATLPGGRSPGERSFTKQLSPAVPEERLLLKVGDKVVYITEPQACDDFSTWSLMLGPSLAQGPKTDSIAFVIEAAAEQGAGLKSLSAKGNVLKWSDYCLPLACSSERPFRAVAEASVENFSRLGVAFMEDRLWLDNGLVPEKIVSVLLRESTLKALAGQSVLIRGAQAETRSLETQEPPEDRSLFQSPCSATKEGTGAAIGSASGQDRGCPPADAAAADAGLDGRHRMETGEQHAEGCHLHLSSCHECLELESSTILSVKCASMENIPDLPDDYMGGRGESDGRGLPSQGRRFNQKPPNVLVYTGGCQERFEHVRALLAECINTDSYVLYPLRPQQVLSEPWLDNTLLLVLAEEMPLMVQHHERFLAYLERGGKLLGLCSSFCAAGLSLAPGPDQRNSVCQLAFTKADCTEVELSALASGHVFVRGDGPAEMWGELRGGSGGMAVVRVTHGDNGGEAVLCQVHLEAAPNSHGVTSPQDFDELKASNALRYEVLSEILSWLGLSCELSHVPPPSPIYVLSSSEECRRCFLEWLQTQVGQGGVLRASRISLKVLPGVESPGALPGGTLALVTQPPQHLPPQFSLETYSLHLRTRTLGRCVLFAETTPSTMDLLEGLMLQLPQEVGLIAIAARQTEGRGRAGNAWLSPLGCAMFTVHMRVPVGSRLGQRIPFLQHLAALAVVEAVRTLPGYEEIDLTVKWPNDIYYGSLMKLGGVLVNSTLMGATFHLLVGCGFNVSNSNPTICINDLVEQQNHQRGSALEPLDTSLLIARSVSLLEDLIASFQDGGPQAVLPLYYKRWVHSGTQVRLQSEAGPQVEVVGLDDNGFLQVQSAELGITSVQPDGNSFDMLRNLVVTKQR